MPTVAIFGGGVGGLTTAHELVERGFQVSIYDLKTDFWGGKARSDIKLGSGVHGRADLPGEHGFRFFPGFYKHLPDTLSRIPFADNANGVLDNLVDTQEYALLREGAPPFIAPINFPTTLADWREAIEAILGANFGIGKPNIEFFLDQLLHLAGSCQARLDYEYDPIAWWDYVQAAARGDAYQKILSEGLTRSLVAVQAQHSSTRTVGTMLLQLIYNMLTPGVQTDRVLNGPTNDQWLFPWVTYLNGKGVVFNLNSTVVSYNVNGGAGSPLRSVTVNVNGTVQNVTADFYVSAVPCEKMAELLTPSLLAAAPNLATIKNLQTSWMNGIQFYLNTDVPIVKGHAIYVDSKWALTSISQHQFWNHIDLSNFGAGNVRGILSVDISDWYVPGDQVIRKAASDCTADEIKTESWAQLKAALGAELQDSYLVDWYLDPDILWGNMQATLDKNKEPLLINCVNSLQWRPTAATQIPNLMLAADYVNTYTNLACMEGADEAGRRATNAILDATRYNGPRCQLWPYESPLIFEAAQELDKIKWDIEHPHQIHPVVVG